MRLWRVTHIVAIVLIVIAIAQLLGRALDSRPAATTLLDRNIGPVEMKDVSYDAAFARLGQASGVTIDIDSAAATELAGRKIDTSMGAETLGVALDALMREANWEKRFFADREIDYYSDRRCIHITTLNHSPKSVRFYDVRDIFEKMVSSYPPDDDPRNPKPVPPGTFGGWGSPPPLISRQLAIEEDQMDQLVSVITNTITPDSWMDAGGSVACIKGSKGWLIVLQTATGHHEIALYLAAIRRADSHKWQRRMAKTR